MGDNQIAPAQDQGREAARVLEASQKTRARRHCHLKSNRVAIVIVRLGLAVSSLMMERHTVVIRSGRARPASEALAVGFLHLGLRARPAGKISVSTDRSEVRGGSGKVVLSVTVPSAATVR